MNPSHFSTLRAMADGSLLRTATLHDKQYLVVPIVSAVGDKVWWPANSPVPELVPASVLEAGYWSRNNRPIVAGHPKRDGEYVSANSPDILEKYSYGHLFAAEFSDKRVKVEAWFDRERAQQVGPAATSIIERLEAGEQIEVSEGNFVVAVDEQGYLEGKEYKSKWVSAVCDHLATVEEGACNNQMGCGGPRVNESLIVSSALSQARTPTYSGTETSVWTKPAFADFIRFCYNGDDPPTSVSKCSADLKRIISNHSLLGNADANSFSDLTMGTVVNPSNGKLNENALRQIINGKMSGMSQLSDSQVTSAKEVAQRLINSEFSANLEANEMNKKDNMLRRMLGNMTSALKSAMSNNELRMKLYKALVEVHPGVSYVYDEDTESKEVIYCVCVTYGEYWDAEMEYHFFRRSFDTTADGVVTVGSDAVEVEWFEGWKDKPSTVEVEEAELVASGNCSCQHKEEKNQMNVNEKKNLVTRLISASKGFIQEGDRQAFEQLSEDRLKSMLAAYEGGEGQTATTETTTTTTATAPSVETKTEVTPIPNDQVLISKEVLADITAAATAHRTQLEKYRSSLISSLTTAQSAFSADDLKGMETQHLEKLATSLKVDQPATVDFSLRGIVKSSVANEKEKDYTPPKSWEMATAERNAKRQPRTN